MPWYNARMGGLPHSTLSLCRRHVLLAPPSHIFVDESGSCPVCPPLFNQPLQQLAPSITSSHHEHPSTHFTYHLCTRLVVIASAPQ